MHTEGGTDGASGGGDPAGLSISSAAAEAPDRPALVAGDRAISYAELADRARVVLGRLRSLAYTGGPVALVGRSDVDTVEAILALIAAGTPIVLLHPRWTEAERSSALEQVAVWSGSERVPLLDVGPDRAGAATEPSPAPGTPDPATPLAIAFTSGTTGRPRGVVLPRRAFVASAVASAANLGWEEDDRWLLPLPVAHVGGLSILTRCLLARRTVVLAERTDPASLLGLISRHGVTLTSLVPTLLERILELDPAAAPPPELRAVLLGGAPAPPALLERAANGGWPVLTTYGLTEACSQVATQPYGTVNRGELGSGRPLPGVDVRIAEDDEIQLRGAMLLTGYLDEPDPFLPDGWFPTGDRGRFDENGNLHLSDRRADRIITGGENVDPSEVERAIERVAGVREAIVFGLPDPKWGEVVSVGLVLEPSAADEGAVEERMAEAVASLAPFKRPRRIALLEALPRNAGGKVDRREAARLATPRLHLL